MALVAMGIIGNGAASGPRPPGGTRVIILAMARQAEIIGIQAASSDNPNVRINGV